MLEHRSNIPDNRSTTPVDSFSNRDYSVSRVNIDHVHFSAKDVGRMLVWFGSIAFLFFGGYYTLKAHTADRLMHSDPEMRIKKGDLVYSDDLQAVKDRVNDLNKSSSVFVQTLKKMKIACVKLPGSQGLECKTYFPSSLELEEGK